MGVHHAHRKSRPKHHRDSSMSNIPVTVKGCELCGENPAREGGRVCEQCMGIPQMKPNADEHPTRKGWHTPWVGENMREANCGEMFSPYKHGSSNPNICLACMRRHSSDGMRGKWLKQFRNDGMLILDSEMLQELLPKIEQDAAMCLRTVEAQCLWYILERARKL